jgi:hypothetical protein
MLHKEQKIMFQNWWRRANVQDLLVVITCALNRSNVYIQTNIKTRRRRQLREITSSHLHTYTSRLIEGVNIQRSIAYIYLHIMPRRRHISR